MGAPCWRPRNYTSRAPGPRTSLGSSRGAPVPAGGKRSAALGLPGVSRPRSPPGGAGHPAESQPPRPPAAPPPRSRPAASPWLSCSRFLRAPPGNPLGGGAAAGGLGGPGGPGGPGGLAARSELRSPPPALLPPRGPGPAPGPVPHPCPRPCRHPCPDLSPSLSCPSPRPCPPSPAPVPVPVPVLSPAAPPPHSGEAGSCPTPAPGGLRSVLPAQDDVQGGPQVAPQSLCPLNVSRRFGAAPKADSKYV
ncbi:proline-rich protein HaeIII subfamily 1-like [Canis lupus dingo]|uniref:proline-rich protein HaeIII subfamily 1-like n=1 Tax=Canis lupus dingo TaxID=286419 RepID=UPI0020C293CB|nr:proline-rich protein HaeIII subfamily 1-like [Canis lupus dingo]